MSTAPLAFGPFRLHIERRLLTRAGEPVHLGARALDLLCALARHRDRIVGKNELMDLAWPGMVVEENNLAVQVGSLRRLLGRQAIATVRSRGYRFAAATVSLEEAEAPGPARRGNLPATLPPLIGRASECAALADWIAAARLVTVIGVGGIGKSRLAQAVAHGLAERWPDGAWMIELAGLADPALLAHAVGQPLGIALREREGASAALAAALAPRAMLLVLDNCEHLLDATAALADRLLASAPGVHLLCTSQEPLRLALEQQFRVDPLAVPADATVPDARDYGALALFVARVRAVDPAFVLDELRLGQAVALCRGLDGLPLAIELAASRVPLLGLRAVHDRLDERLRLLTCGHRSGLPRHQTLRAAMAWSHGLLDDAQRAVFRRLGVFCGGFTMPLAHALCPDAPGAPCDVLEHIGALANKSLVLVEPSEPPRYRLLESMRAFALEQLAGHGEAAAAQRSHARALTQFLREVDDANLDGELRTDAYAARVLPELDNLRAAYAWACGADGDRSLAIALAASATPLSDYSSEFRGWLLAQWPLAAGVSLEPRIEARLARGMAAFNMSGEVPTHEAHAAALRAAALYRTLGLPKRMVSSLRLAATWLIVMGDHARAAAALDEAGALVQPDWGAEFRLTLLRSRTRLASEIGQLDQALQTAREEIELARRSGDWRLEVIARTNHAEIVWQAGELERAAALLEALRTEIGSRPVTDFERLDLLQLQCGVASEHGHVEHALRFARAALPAMRATRRFSLPVLAHLFWRLDRCDAAAQLVRAFDARNSAGLEIAGPNEARLLAATRAGLAQRLPRPAPAARQQAGTAPHSEDIHALLAAELGD